MVGGWRKRLVPYFFISPFFLGYGIFFAYPVLRSLYLSFFEQEGVESRPRFVGFDNFASLLGDEAFIKSVVNTTYYAAGSIFLIVPAALGLALLLTARNLRFREFFRLFFFLPYVMSGVVVAIIFTLVFDREYGMLNNYVLSPLGFGKAGWLDNPLLVMPAVILIGLWRYVGLNALYFMVGLQNVPAEIKEAARIDGANGPQVFYHVTLPLLRPILIFVLTFAVIGSYNLFAEPQVLVGPEGGPRNAGLTITMYLYLVGFRFLDFGYASAIGWTLTLIIVVLSLVQLRLLGVFRGGLT